jgi:hypothetical protein
MAITERTLRLQHRLEAQLAQITDAQTRDLVRAWVIAWDEIEPDLTAALLEQLISGDQITRTQLLRSTRLRNALGVVRGQLEDLAGRAGVRITGDLAAVIDAAGGAQASVIDSQLPALSDHLVDLDAWSRVDERQVAAIVNRSTQQITSALKPLAPETYDVVRRELIRGVAAGSNPRETARRMVARANQRFNGKLGLTRALVISRTETLDAHRAAAALGQEQHADVLAGWEWLAELDSRTCPSCWGKHGSRHPLSEPGPFDHHQGRCSRCPVTKSWADLGFDIPEPASVMVDAEARFGSLSAAEQKQILGPGRYDAWVAGDFPLGSWSVRRSNDGWRDSFVPAKVPAQSGGRVSRSAA